MAAQWGASAMHQTQTADSPSSSTAEAGSRFAETVWGGFRILLGSLSLARLSAIIAAPIWVLQILFRFEQTQTILDLANKLSSRLFGVPEETEHIWLLLTSGTSAVLVFWVMHEGFHWLKQKSLRARRLRKYDPASADPNYFRIGSYVESDRATFHRADQIHERILNWIEEQQPSRRIEMPLYLAGDSGCGKTSLLEAYVLPQLRERGWIVLKERAGQDPEAAMRQALEPHGLQGSGPLRDLIAAATRQRVDRRQIPSLLLVLDQFEECLIPEQASAPDEAPQRAALLGDPQRKAAFADLIADLRRNPLPRFRLLLVLRRDYQGHLADIDLPQIRQDENYKSVERFNLTDAQRFLRASGLALEYDAVKKLCESAAALDGTRGYVRPITLNVIGRVLSTYPGDAPSLDAAHLIGLYIQDTVEHRDIRDWAPQVLDHLVTGQATKCPRTITELAAVTGLSPSQVHDVLLALGERSLARPLDPDQQQWELSHDFVAAAIARYLGRRHRHLVSRAIAYAAPVVLAATLIVATAMARTPNQTIGTLSGLGFHAQFDPAREGYVVKNMVPVTAENLQESIRVLGGLRPIKAMLLDRRDLVASKSSPVGAWTSSVESPSSIPSVKAAPLDLGPLAELDEIRELTIDGIEVQNLEPLRKLHKLRELNLSGIGITDVGPLGDLAALELLYISSAAMEGCPTIPGLTSLPSAAMDLAPLTRLSALKGLNLCNAQVDNLDPLQDLPQLNTICLPNGFPQDKFTEFLQYRKQKGLSLVNLKRQDLPGRGPEQPSGKPSEH
jgi:hypothetical protein